MYDLWEAAGGGVGGKEREGDKHGLSSPWRATGRVLKEKVVDHLAV